jgi:predicted  nucleic acid-binding Zn-ribbon protein
MKNIRNRHLVRSRISTMPRNKSDASSQLDLYKLVTEKQRINRELSGIKERMTVLQKSLDVLNQEIEATERTINKLRQTNPKTTDKFIRSNILEEANNYHAFEIEY